MSGSRYTGRKVAADDMSNRAALLWGGGVLLAIAIYVAFSVTAFNGLPWKGYRTVYATVPATGNLIKHDQVRIAGVRVGQMLGSEITDDGQAKLKLQLEPGTEVPEGTKVFIRANGLLGARYIQLEPGKSARMLPDGAVIKGTEESFAYGVPEFLNTFDRDTRTALGTAVRELGTGMLANGGRVNETIDSSAAATKPFQRLIGAVLARPGAAESLLPSLNRLVLPLNQSRDAMAAMFPAADTAFRPFVDERDALRATLDRAPAALDAVRSGLGTGERLLAATGSLATEVHRTLPGAPAGLRATAAMLREGRTPARLATPLVKDVRATVPSILRVTDAASPVLSPLSRGLRDLISVFDQVAPYSCDYKNFGANMRSMTGFGGTAGTKTPSGSPPIAFRLQILLTSPQSYVGAPNPSLTKDPREGYPKPCRWKPSVYDHVPGAGMQP
jgi:phospholipid/cholesterol/gamma-HCH transport system substrate-binding protein